MKAEDIESFLTGKLISEISNFGDGTTEFHTRDLDKILEIINCKNDALSQKQNDIDELVNSIESAMRIANIWAIDYANLNVQECNIGEVAALSMMRQTFEILIQKHTK